MAKPRLVMVDGDAVWLDSPFTKPLLEGKVGMYGAYMWSISYRGFNGSFEKIADKKDFRFGDGYTLWVGFGEKEQKYRGDIKRMDISPSYIKLYRFKTQPQVKKAFKKFIDNLLSDKIKCNDCGTSLTFNTIDSCISCNMNGKPQFFCKKHLFTHTKMKDPYYFCRTHIKRPQYDWDDATMSDEDLRPKEQTNAYEIMLKKRLGLEAEEWDDKPTVEEDDGGKPSDWFGGMKHHWSSYYRGYKIALSKATPKKNGEGYDVWIQWDESKMGHRESRRQMMIPSQYLGLQFFKTMPQVKKAIKQFIDEIEAGKMKCESCAKSVTWKSIETCHACSSNSYHSFSKASPGIYCKRCIYTSEKLPPSYEGGSRPDACKEDTLNSIFHKVTGKHLVLEVSKNGNKPADIEDRYMRRNVALEKEGITDADLIPLMIHNPYEVMLRKRLGLEAEEKKMNPLLIGAGILVLLSYLKS